MAVVVKEDVIAGSSASRNLRKGEERIRIFTVSGVVGDGHEKYSNAMDANGIPKDGDPHPSVDDIVVKHVACFPHATDIIGISVKYAAPDSFIPTRDQTIITVSGGLTQTETNLDINGNVMFTEYTYPDSYPEAPDLAGETRQHSAMVPLLIPTVVKSFQQLQDFDPSGLASVYQGRINSNVFEGGAVGTWMCTNISGDSQNGGKDWNNTYSFEYRYDGWNQDIVFIVPVLGEPPVFTQAELALGVRRYQIYPQANFGDLRLA